MSDKPLMIFDGDCGFCRRWIERWRRLTKGAVDYEPYQKVHHLFPEIKKESFQASVQFVEPGRKISSGAQAVFKSLQDVPGKKWLIHSYQKVPGFKFISESLYRLVACHRQFFSFLTRVFWGGSVLPSTYTVSSQIFLTILGFIYAAAFLSLSVQIKGLYGSAGIFPVTEFLAQVKGNYPHEAFWYVPSFFWFDSSDKVLQLSCFVGAGLGILFSLGVMRPLLGLLLWALYLSVFSVGQTFLSFQWDILLLEVGFLAIFLPKFKFFQIPWKSTAYRPIFHGLFLWLLFRLMFSSGIVKLLSEDPAWTHLTALNFHYETQPLPTWIGYYAHQLLPAWFQKASVASMFFIELVLPFFIFLPRNLKQWAAWPLIALQVLIVLTGNYCFFNLLTIALCFFLLDDCFWIKEKEPSLDFQQNKRGVLAKRFIGIPVILTVFLLSVVQFSGTLRLGIAWPRAVVDYLAMLRPLRLTSTYGLFAVMTTERNEIILEGSRDGRQWVPYDFKYKPDDLKQRPKFIIPHQPRLDWQMWFAALGNYHRNPWLVRLCVRVLEGSEDVLGLFERNPFPSKPPKYIRAAIYTYEFTDVQEKRETGHWWKRRRQGLYLKTLSLKV